MSSLFSSESVPRCMTSSQSISESESLRTSSLHASHDMCRSLTKVAVASIYSAKGVPCELEPGGKFNTIKGEIGDDDYKSLCKDPELALVRINYCQSGLRESSKKLSKEKITADSGKSDVSQAEVESIKKVRSLINHDYLVLELQRGGTPSRGKFYVLAHKLGKGGKLGKAGIFISAIDMKALEAELHDGVKLLAIDCGNKRIPLKSLFKILKEADPRYCVADKNCWDYATDAAKRLVLKCAEVAGTSADEKARLVRESSNLEAELAQKHIVNTTKKVLDMGSKVLDLGSSSLRLD